MKKTDIATVVFIALVSVIIAYFVASAIFGTITTNGVQVKTIDVITPQVDTPNTDIFNSNAINPSVEVQISSASQTSGSQ